MELLIIKSGRDYIRYNDDNYLFVRLDKASVFPLDRMEQVKQHESRLKEQGFYNVCIRKLILTEEDI